MGLLVFNKRMASEVPTHELDALVTCGFFFLNRIFTLKVLKKLYVNFNICVAFLYNG
jgi:hypothetical protein